MPSWDPENDIVTLPTFEVLSSNTPAPSSGSGWGGLWDAVGGFLGTVAQGVAKGAADNIVTRATGGNRTPGQETTQNPLSQPTTTAAPPPTSIIPGIPNATLFIGAGVVGFGVLAAILASRGK